MVSECINITLFFADGFSSLITSNGSVVLAWRSCACFVQLWRLKDLFLAGNAKGLDIMQLICWGYNLAEGVVLSFTQGYSLFDLHTYGPSSSRHKNSKHGHTLLYRGCFPYADCRQSWGNSISKIWSLKSLAFYHKFTIHEIVQNSNFTNIFDIGFL